MPRSIDLRRYQTAIKDQKGDTCTTYCSIAALEAAYKRAGYGDLDLSEDFFIYMIKTFWLDKWSDVRNREAGGRETQIGNGAGGNGPESLELLASGFKVPAQDVWTNAFTNSSPERPYSVDDHPWLANRYTSDFWDTQKRISDFNLESGFLKRSHLLANTYYGARDFTYINKTNDFIDRLEAALSLEREVVIDSVWDYEIENQTNENTRLLRSGGLDGRAHCVLLVGFNRTSRNPSDHYFIAKNSWGRTHGTAREDGFTYLSYDFVRTNGLHAGYIDSVIEPGPWPELGFVGRWKLSKASWHGRVDIYHLPGIMQSVLNRRSSSERIRDRRIGTFYGDDGSVLRVNGSIQGRTIEMYLDRRNPNARYDNLGGQKFTYIRQENEDVALGTMQQNNEENYGGYMIRYGQGTVPRPTRRLGIDARRDSAIPLYNWWNAESRDNFLTSNPHWSLDPRALIYRGHHIQNQWKKKGYSMYRFEGQLFNPRRGRPEGTVPLFSWWNESRKDYFMSSDPRWVIPTDQWEWDEQGILGRAEGHSRLVEGYRLYRFEGYVYDPKRPQPTNTVPLYSWWNSRRKDNKTTTDPRWSIDPGTVRWRGNNISNGTTKEGYRLYRLEGYVLKP